MANFKRKRPKNARAGCLLCHPEKMNGAPAFWRYGAGDLRRLGGRDRRVARHDVDWRLREEELGKSTDSRE